MALLAKTADYTDRDFDSIRERLFNLISSVFPTWTDRNVADFGNILVELFADVGDTLGFYQDNQARQSRISTATQRRALISLVKLIGYQAASATAATATLTIALPAPPAGDVFFRAGDVVRTPEVTAPIAYQLLADAVISAGQNPPTASVVAENSATRAQVYTSTGLPNQAFMLPVTPFIDGSVVVVAGNGAFTQVPNFLNSTATDRHFTVSVDQNDRATVRFGNGVAGAIPTGTVTFIYKTGGGSAGRVEEGKLREFEKTTWTDSLGNTVAPTVTNPSASAGGTDRQSVAQIKERAPASIRVINRTVSREDYEINALRLPAVARALMLTSNEDPTIQENTGELYVVPVGGGVATQALLDAVKYQVTVAYPNTLTFDCQVKPAIYKDLDFYMVVFFKAGVNKPAAAAAIRASLAALLAVQNADGTANTEVDFGANIRDSLGVITAEVALSDLTNAVRDVSGVRKLDPSDAGFLVNGAHTDVPLLGREFPRLGTVQIFDGDTGEAL